MPTELTWTDIGLRLALTFLAGALIGINREEHARPAGLRTVLLVCLAAAISMIQANLLLNTAGKKPDSFIIMDLMRLPLGILSGMGFIGAGAILRKDNIVLGVTTAATLWFATVMGLCFGGGQLGLGLASLVLGLIVLSGLKKVEAHWPQDKRGTLVLAVGPAGPGDEEISQLLPPAGYKITSWSVTYANDREEREFKCVLRWHERPAKTVAPEFLKALAARAGVKRLDWRPD